jgi:ABC-type polar amino acid transport system ATPase subunit
LARIPCDPSWLEASWTLITKDQVMREKYDRIKIRSGGKRAIVAIARTLLLRMRRMLLNKQVYELQLAA